jgi:DNA repair exonuclease SbcCD ATPase subunit
MLDQYTQSLQQMRAHYNVNKGQRDLLQSQLQTAQTELTQAKQDITTWESVQILLGKVSEFARTQILEHIQNTVSAALYAVFGEGYKFQIAMKTIGNQPAAEWQVVSSYGDTEVVSDPENSRGGGIVDVVSLALRLAMLELLRPKPEGILMLDEPGKMISQQYAPNLAYFLKQYAAKMGRQILLITHNPVLAEVADRSYLVTQTDGVSEVKQLG